MELDVFVRRIYMKSSHCTNIVRSINVFLMFTLLLFSLPERKLRNEPTICAGGYLSPMVKKMYMERILT